MACPWDSFSLVTTQFCERPLCAWIKEPANTWSNLTYILIGIWLWRRAKKERAGPLVWVGIVAVFTGLGSFFFHMSKTYLGGCLDYFGMFLGTGLLTGYNSRRYFDLTFANMYLIFGGITFFLFFLLHFLPDESRYVYGLGMPCCILELMLFVRDRKKINYRSYLVAWGLTSLATIFWWLDVTKRFCNPDNHFFSGHALWHVLTATAFIPLFQYYRQFSSLND